MSETASKWDAADHLRTPEDARLYLEACAEEDPGDGSLMRAALHDIARSRNMGQLAREAGMRRRGALQGIIGKRQSHSRNSHADHAGFGNEGANHHLVAVLTNVAAGSRPT